MALLEIDLNLDVTDIQQCRAQVPDLNAKAIDLNFSPCASSENDTDIELQQETNPESDETTNDLSQIQKPLKKSKNLTNYERRAIHDMLLQKSRGDGKLPRGVRNMVASVFSVSIRTVGRIWKQSRNSGIYADVSHKRVGNCGRKRIDIDFARLRDIPLHKRTTLDSLACSMGLSKSTMFRHLKSGAIRRHSNTIKPFLKEENKRSRLQFCIDMLDESSIPDDPIFKGMYNIIHIDEKWFNLTKKSEKYYLLADEDEPVRSCKNKNFIGKVMFLVAIARPRFDAQGSELFFGKIGVFPFVRQEPAKKSSVNRVAGTLETKLITSVNREVVRSFMIEKVLPAIQEKWPREDLRGQIFIQQDNARTHIDHNDDGFRQAATQYGLDIHLMNQPANSPDLNLLDLGFFSAIQSLQYKEAPKTVDELVDVVVKSFNVFPAVKSNNIFLTLQLCMIEILKARGSNKYKIPHMKKAVLERNGRFPTQMKCDCVLIQEVLHYLS